MLSWKCRRRSVTRSALPLPTIIVSLFLSACGGGIQEGGGSAAIPSTPSSPSPAAPATADLKVSWQPVADARVAAYKLYYSSAPLDSGAPAQSVNVGDATSYTFNPSAAGIAPGSTVYFAVAAIGSGMESPPSDAVSLLLQ